MVRKGPAGLCDHPDTRPTRNHTLRLIKDFGRLALATLLAAGLSLPAAANGYRTGPAPDWVRPVEPDTTLPAPDDAPGGVHYLLTDLQLRNQPSGETAYTRFATRALDASGLGQVANIEIDFDPSFQTLTLHAVDVVRDGRRSSRLGKARVELLQREKELEARIFDGRVTAAIFLEDVRVGDIVDYAFSTEGSNPVFGGAAFGSIYLQWSVPVAHDHTRLMLAPGMTVQTRSENGAVEPRVQRLADGFLEYTWEQRDVPGQSGESDVPGWHDARPRVQWSQFRDWGEVVAWARPLYALPRTLGAELEEEIAGIAAREPTPTGRMLAALRFVQAEVRYLGVEVGINSHAPSPPDQVLARRFGDCKDKTVLLLAMLDRLGVTAAPALVHTGRTRGTATRLPSPTAFDHVLVRAEIDGRVAWLDPTRSAQPGGLDDIHQPDFGLALVVAPGSTGLVAMREPGWQPPLREVHLGFDARKGLDEPTELEVRTVLRGLAAESMRAELASKGSRRIGEDYLAYYAGFYPGLEPAQPLAVEDEPSANRISLVERYRIPAFWSEPGKDTRRTASLHGFDLLGELKLPPAGQRRAPLAVGHPVDFLQVTDLRLPEDWPVDETTEVVDDPAFRYVRRYERLERGHRIRITDRYTSRADHVEPGRVAEYAARMRQAREATGFELYWAPPADGAGAGVPDGIIAAVLTGFLWCLLLLAAAVAFFFYDPRPRPGPADPALAGLGGWLVLPLIGLVLTPMVVLVQVVPALDVYSGTQWQLLTTPGAAAYHPLWAPLLLADLCLSLSLLLLPPYVLLLMLLKRRSAPLAYILLLVGSLLAQGGILTGLAAIPSEEPLVAAADWAGVVRSAIAAAIWIPYFLVSRRVRATFVRGWRGAPQPPPVPGVIMAAPTEQEARP